MIQTFGMLMRPCSAIEAENETIWKSSEFYTEANFYSEYSKHIIAMQHIAECAKIYITKKWAEVSDWKYLNVVIQDNSGTKTEYFNYIPRNKHTTTKSSVRERMEADRAKRHNPISTITDVVLDPTDGDFSLTINGKCHLWIDNESVIIIAAYIEKTLTLNKINKTY